MKRTLWIVAAMVFVGIGSIGSKVWLESKSRDARQVAALYQAGRMAEGRARVDRWLAKSPDSPDGLLWKARLSLAERRMDEAAQALQRSKALGSDPAERELVVALAEAISGRFAESEPILRAAFNAREYPDPLLDEVLSRIYLETYDLPRAGLAIKRWMIDFPSDPKPYLWRAEIDSRTGDAALALADYRQALDRDPHLARALLGLAEELRKAHKTAEAAETFDRYLALAPEDPAGHLGAGRNAAEGGDAPLAIQHLQRALTLQPENAIAHRSLADVLSRQGDLNSAFEQVEKANALDPHDLETHHLRGQLLTRLGRLDDAKFENLETARLRSEESAMLEAQASLATAPNNLEAKLTITRWLLRHGKEAEGVRWAEAILREHPGQPEATRLLAEHYEHIGNPGLANFYRTQINDKN